MNNVVFIFYGLCVISGTAEIIVYQPNYYFSGQNPASHWSFGFTSPDDHLSFRLYSNYASNAYGNTEFINLQLPSMSGFALWYVSDLSGGISYANQGLVGMNMNKQKNVQYHNEFELKPGQMCFHPGINNARATIRFTVPTSGFYDMESVFFAPGFTNSTPADVTTDVHLSVNNVEHRSLWISRKPGILMLKQFYLNIDDNVQFEVGWGKNKNYYYDTTAVDIRITYYN
jgi:hypothetical protein